MSNDKFKLIMSYLDIIEAEMDKIAIATAPLEFTPKLLADINAKAVDLKSIIGKISEVDLVLPFPELEKDFTGMINILYFSISFKLF